jgi:hypothetical protein
MSVGQEGENDSPSTTATSIAAANGRRRSLSRARRLPVESSPCLSEKLNRRVLRKNKEDLFVLFHFSFLQRRIRFWAQLWAVYSYHSPVLGPIEPSSLRKNSVAICPNSFAGIRWFRTRCCRFLELCYTDTGMGMGMDGWIHTLQEMVIQKYS